jgi:plasmid stabilization system protein ParE
MRVRLSPTARERFSFIDAWWRANRDRAPDLFERELTRVIELLPTAPAMGNRYATDEHGEIRRVLLKKTRQYVYYRVRESEGLIEIVSIWGVALSLSRLVPGRASVDFSARWGLRLSSGHGARVALALSKLASGVATGFSAPFSP